MQGSGSLRAGMRGGFPRVIARGFANKLSVGGRGGRSSVSGLRFTVFGAGGFLGRYVCNQLGKEGHIGILPNRGCEMEYRHLKPMFDLGQCAQPFYHARDEDSIRAAIAGSDVVINLVGKQYETKHLVPQRLPDGSATRTNFTFEEANADVPARIARIAAEEGVKRFVHVSALNQDADSESAWARSKASGEQKVRSAFPGATILRPAIMFGVEDTFLNYFSYGAAYPFCPVVNDGAAIVQPVYVGDVARAVLAAANSSRSVGKTYELVGAEEYTLRECAEYVYDVTGLQNNLVDVPLPVMKMVGRFCNALPSFARPLFTEDSAVMMAAGSFKDSDLPGLEAFKITPSAMEKNAWSYMHRYRAGGHFVLASGAQAVDRSELPSVK